ncbi:hypothetical protein, partial [Xenorhabdus indica]|uniref:hypothetical protein n=1 Tax=Xenorhabdus indica TaxID=333964 RepID=UPI0021D5186B
PRRTFWDYLPRYRRKLWCSIADWFPFDALNNLILCGFSRQRANGGRLAGRRAAVLRGRAAQSPQAAPCDAIKH